MLLTTVRYYYTPNRVAEVQKIGYTTHWWGGFPKCGETKTHTYHQWGWKMIKHLEELLCSFF